jgi:vanillate O-demethylase monooxygenase subunit
MEAGMFLRNAWYVAAWDHEISQNLLARTIMDESIVFFRTEDGSLAALEDRCCHRHAPLSAGRLVGNEVECGYHGFVFDRTGRCVRVPGQARVPTKAAVRGYPVVERHRWVWIWMGDAAHADESLVPNMYWHKHPEWRMIGDYFHVKCHYQNLIDIQLDQTHSQYVHPSSLGNRGALMTAPRLRREGRALLAERLMPDSDPPPIWRRAINYPHEKADVWIKWTYILPASISFDTGIAEPGTGAFEGNRSRGITVYTAHGITPESERTTHHFWTCSRNFRLDDEELNRTIGQIRNTFMEDVQMVEAQQRAIDRFPNAPQVDVPSDAPTIQARKLLAGMIEAECSGASACEAVGA